MTLCAPARNSLPPGWAECSIADVTLPVSKIDPRADPAREIRYIDISGIDNARNVIGDTKTYRLGDAPSRARQIVRAGDVLFATVRPYLRNIAAVPPEYDQQIASTGFAVLRPAPGINPAFLFYVATSADFVNALSGLQYGVSYPAVTDDQVRARPMPLPPTREQARIVAKIEELFSELDDGVANLQRARDQLEIYRQAVLKHAFRGRLTEQWRQENQGDLMTAEQVIAHLTRVREQHYKAVLAAWETRGNGTRAKRPRKPDPVRPIPSDAHSHWPQLPEGWCYVRAAELCDVVRGGSPRPAGDLRYYEGPIPFLKVADLTRTSGPYVDAHSYSIKEAGLTKTRLVEPPILMLSNSGATLGVPKICRIRATFNDGIAAFLGVEEDALLYHYYFWASKTGELRAIDQGAAQPNLNTDLIGDVVVPVCAPQEMRAVATEVERLLSKCEQLSADIEDQLAKVAVLRHAVLRAAFSGQLVVQNPDDEPASALLERIARENRREAQQNGARRTGKRRRTST